jgi:hypothetical protein
MTTPNQTVAVAGRAARSTTPARRPCSRPGASDMCWRALRPAEPSTNFKPWAGTQNVLLAIREVSLNHGFPGPHLLGRWRATCNV